MSETTVQIHAFKLSASGCQLAFDRVLLPYTFDMTKKLRNFAMKKL